MGEKLLMKGNEAIARAALRQGAGIILVTP